MCYDVSFAVDVDYLTDYIPDLIFEAELQKEFGPMDHIQGVGVFAKHPIVYVDRTDFKLHCRLMEWSVIEFFRKEEPDLKKRNGMLNIRAERILDDKASYWYKIRNRRCLIPVTGIYEHRAIQGWKKKVPYWIRPDKQEIFFLPGLYSVAEIVDRQTGEMVQRWSYGLITRAANSLMRNIHNDGDNRYRMPLFLPFDVSMEFLREDLSEQRYREILSYEMPAADLICHPVFTIRTSKLREDNKPKTEFWAWDNLPVLGMGNPD